MTDFVGVLCRGLSLGRVGRQWHHTLDANFVSPQRRRRTKLERNCNSYCPKSNKRAKRIRTRCHLAAAPTV